MSLLRPAVFLDRDGVLNRTLVRDGVPHPPDRAEQVEILPGVADALASLAQRELPLIVVTNQPDVARGKQSRQEVERINRFLQERLPLTVFYVCYHDTPDNCACRKPKAGLLIEAAGAYNIDLPRSVMVGDRWSDIAAGQAAGCRTVLIDLPHSQGNRCTPDARVSDLAAAVDRVLKWIE
jgi:D-glycero-D-manno-heptose 1,7-bisphosphate phosphatase